MSEKTKTLLFWKPKRCRKPKMVGTATAICSALHIMRLSRMALNGDGVFYIIDADTANVGRAIIRIYDQNKSTPERFKVPISDTNGRIVAIGERAMKALEGAGRSISMWETRIKEEKDEEKDDDEKKEKMEQGCVTPKQSKALT